MELISLSVIFPEFPELIDIYPAHKYSAIRNMAGKLIIRWLNLKLIDKFFINIVNDLI